jgi:methylenetetrahydrofolate dehydrogenase (NADP+)/methenyltetrahydrofolate cyclohydrolase
VDCRPLASAIREQVRADLEAVRTRRGALPRLAVVLVGDDPASHVYAARISRSAADVGVESELVTLAPDIAIEGLRARLGALDADADVGGIILQLPLPAPLALTDVRDSIDPAKDLDGIHPQNAGRVAQGEPGFTPSCAEAALEVLHWLGIPLDGARAVVVGRSNVVGKPAALLLIREHATVTVCHRGTRDLGAEVRAADVVVAAAGSPGLITGDMVAPGAVVVDCGINVVDGRVVGDVDVPSVAEVARIVTATPGGVGPVTNAVLLRHFARAAGALTR